MFARYRYYLKRYYHLVKTGLLEGIPAQIRYHFPARKITQICITGTDGKTTTSTLLYHLLQSYGIKVGLISTIGGYIGTELIDTGFHVTSPNPSQLHQLLATMIHKGCTHVVIETTSHGIYQYRTWGLKPSIVGLTNITHEHLDYHTSWEEYVKAKRKLLISAPQVYVNAQDKSYALLQKMGWPKKTTVNQYTTLQDLPATVKVAIKKRFPETYNQANATLACTIASTLGVPTKRIPESILSFKGIPGRMEVVSAKPFEVIVDFAHTPHALEEALQAARNRIEENKKVIIVFGCAGNRDWQKRPLMGDIAARLADVSVFTAEDPRTENVWSIIRQMKDGITSGHDRVISIAERKNAIAFALQQLAKPGDIVLITGKGHEQSMCYGDVEYPWNDVAAVKALL